MRRLAIPICIALVLLLALAIGPARAGLMRYDVTANSFSPVWPDINAVVEVELEKGVSVTDRTSGITLSIPFFGTLAYSYDAVKDILTVGGLTSDPLDTADTLSVFGTKDDFVLVIRDALLTPQMSYFGVWMPENAVPDFFESRQGLINAQSALVVPVPVPEPGGLMLVVIALGGLCAASRRRAVAAQA